MNAMFGIESLRAAIGRTAPSGPTRLSLRFPTQAFGLGYQIRPFRPRRQLLLRIRAPRCLLRPRKACSDLRARRARSTSPGQRPGSEGRIPGKRVPAHKSDPERVVHFRPNAIGDTMNRPVRRAAYRNRSAARSASANNCNDGSFGFTIRHGCLLIGHCGFPQFRQNCRNQRPLFAPFFN